MPVDPDAVIVVSPVELDVALLLAGSELERFVIFRFAFAFGFRRQRRGEKSILATFCPKKFGFRIKVLRPLPCFLKMSISGLKYLSGDHNEGLFFATGCLVVLTLTFAVMNGCFLPFLNSRPRETSNDTSAGFTTGVLFFVRYLGKVSVPSRSHSASRSNIGTCWSLTPCT